MAQPSLKGVCAGLSHSKASEGGLRPQSHRAVVMLTVILRCLIAVVSLAVLLVQVQTFGQILFGLGQVVWRYSGRD